MPVDLRLVRLQPEYGELGIGEIAQARMIGAAAIFAAAPCAVEAGELRNRPVRIHDDDRQGTKREEAPEIPGKLHKLGSVAAVDREDRRGPHTARTNAKGPEDEWVKTAAAAAHER